MKEPVENDDLWQILGKSSRVEASPYFARKVRRAIESETRRPAFASGILRWLMPLSACAAVVLAWNVHHWRMEQDRLAAQQFNELFDEAAGLRSLVSSQDISSWIASGN